MRALLLLFLVQSTAQISPTPSPTVNTRKTLLGQYQFTNEFDTNMTKTNQMESWLGTQFSVILFFTQWCPAMSSSLDWYTTSVIREHLITIWDSGSVPLMTWQPSCFDPSLTTLSNTTTNAKTPDTFARQIGNGQYDTYITSVATELKTFLSGPDEVYGNSDDRRVYLRLGQQMNSDLYQWCVAKNKYTTTTDYINMWKRVRQVFDKQLNSTTSSFSTNANSATTAVDMSSRIQWIWSPNNFDTNSSYTAESYYPGDEYVDWLGASVYNPNSNGGNSGSASVLMTPILKRFQALSYNKPISISEFGSDYIASLGIAYKAAWLDDFFNTTNDFNLGMIVQLNSGKNAVYGSTSVPNIDEYKNIVSRASSWLYPVSSINSNSRLVSDAAFMGNLSYPATRFPTLTPTQTPTLSHSPSYSPSKTPSVLPSYFPSVKPSTTPTAVPSVSPSCVPSATPTVVPSVSPSYVPSTTPTVVPSLSPSYVPSTTPTVVPSLSPSYVLSTTPTVVPSVSPSYVLSPTPTVVPSVSPSYVPSTTPTVVPSVSPSYVPSTTPTVGPSVSPSYVPSTTPSAVPSVSPSVKPSVSPNAAPTLAPTTAAPTQFPSFVPSTAPTTTMPTIIPSAVPTTVPSFEPTKSPSIVPSISPTTISPSFVPSTTPTTVYPTLEPTTVPSVATTTTFPTVFSEIPDLIPSLHPSFKPTEQPISFPNSYSISTAEVNQTLFNQSCTDFLQSRDAQDSFCDTIVSILDEYSAEGNTLTRMECSIISITCVNITTSTPDTANTNEFLKRRNMLGFSSLRRSQEKEYANLNIQQQSLNDFTLDVDVVSPPPVPPNNQQKTVIKYSLNYMLDTIEPGFINQIFKLFSTHFNSTVADHTFDRMLHIIGIRNGVNVIVNSYSNIIDGIRLVNYVITVGGDLFNNPTIAPTDSSGNTKSASSSLSTDSTTMIASIVVSIVGVCLILMCTAFYFFFYRSDDNKKDKNRFGDTNVNDTGDYTYDDNSIRPSLISGVDNPYGHRSLRSGTFGSGVDGMYSARSNYSNNSYYRTMSSATNKSFNLASIGIDSGESVEWPENVERIDWKELAPYYNTSGGTGELAVVGQGAFGKVVKVNWSSASTSSIMIHSTDENEIKKEDIVVKLMTNKKAVYTAHNSKNKNNSSEEEIKYIRDALDEVSIINSAESKIFYKDCIIKVYGVAIGTLPESLCEAFNISANTAVVGIIMRYEAGGSLNSIIHPNGTNNSSSSNNTGAKSNLSMLEKIRLLMEIARGLAELHTAGIVHGDIKPDNVLLSHSLPVKNIGSADSISSSGATDNGVIGIRGSRIDDVANGSSDKKSNNNSISDDDNTNNNSDSAKGSDKHQSPAAATTTTTTTTAIDNDNNSPPVKVRLADFGLSRQHEALSSMAASTLEHTAHVKGTPIYCAPEMLANPYSENIEEEVARASRKTDMYAFALLAWEVLTEQRPFSDIKNESILYAKVHQGYRPTIGKNISRQCPQRVIAMIQACWSSNRRERKSAVQCYVILQQAYAMMAKTPFDVLLLTSDRYHSCNHNLPKYIFHRLTQNGINACFLDTATTSTATVANKSHSNNSSKHADDENDQSAGIVEMADKAASALDESIDNNNSSSDNKPKEDITSTAIETVNNSTTDNNTTSTLQTTTVTLSQSLTRDITPRVWNSFDKRIHRDSYVYDLTYDDINNNNNMHITTDNSISTEKLVLEQEEGDISNAYDSVDNNTSSSVNKENITLLKNQEYQMLQNAIESSSKQAMSLKLNHMLLQSKAVLVCVNEAFQNDESTLFVLINSFKQMPSLNLIPIFTSPDHQKWLNDDVKYIFQLRNQSTVYFDFSDLLDKDRGTSFVANGNRSSAVSGRRGSKTGNNISDNMVDYIDDEDEDNEDDDGEEEPDAETIDKLNNKVKHIVKHLRSIVKK